MTPKLGDCRAMNASVRKQNDIDLITKTLNLLEDLAKNGITRVSINVPPPEHSNSRLPGIFALIPVTKKDSYPSDKLWCVVDKHGGHGCGNGMGYTPDKTQYWCQSQVHEQFFTGHFTWEGQETKEYRKWMSPELLKLILFT